MPSGRSGHSLTFIGASNYLLYGGIEDAKKNGKIQPNGDIYTMKIASSGDCTWEKQSPQGDECPVARTQHIALATPKNDRVFVFGGHHNPKTRLNDCWFLTTKDFEWVRVGGEKDNLSN